MVRQLHMEMDDDEFENTQIGCTWGIFHALNYNYWQKNVKKILPYRNHLPKYSKGTGRPRTRLSAYDSDDAEDLLEASRVPVSSNTGKTSSTKRKSLRTRIKSLISEEPPKKDTHKGRGSGSLTQSRFQRTYSIHHREGSDYVVRKSTKKDSEVKGMKNRGYYRKFSRNGTGPFSKKYEAEDETSEDALEIYKANKDLFKGLKHSDGGIGKSFCNLETREARAKLLRSGSYPSPKLSQVKSFKSSKLDHKQNEIWSPSRVEKLFANTPPQVVDGTTKFRRRTLSLNDSSFDKYAQLLPKSSIGEPKFSSSKSSRLTSEGSFKRARSLSHIDFNGFFQNRPSCDGHSAVLLVKEDRDSDRNVENDSRLYEDIERNGSNIKVDDTSNLVESITEHDISEEIAEQIIAIEDSKGGEEIDFVEVPEEKLPRSCSSLVVQSDLEEDATSLTDVLASKDFKCENSLNDKESPVDLHSECSSKSISRPSATSNERFFDAVDEIELHIRSYDDFDYVSNILDRSGFSRNALLATWYLEDQPLNPSVFEEMEACWPHEDSCPEDEFCCHHQLLFDLINEALVQIFDKSFTLYPRALSSTCRVRRMPMRFNVVDEVWGKVSEIMNSKLGSDQTVEGIVAQDMWRDDSWMNLQLESECVALELEDLLLDELLEDIIRF